MNESIDNLVAYQPSPDALAEISVETNNYSADTGNVAGAVISNVIKSGTNQFRGNAFEFYRNSKMDANSVLQQSLECGQAGAQAEHLRRHDRRADRQEQGVLLRQLPGDALRSRRVGARFGRARDAGVAATSLAPRPSRDPLTEQCRFANNQIPTGADRAQSRNAILSNTALYPLPNRAPASGLREQQFRRRPAADDQGKPGRRPRRLERFQQRQDLRPLLASPSTEDVTDKRAFPLLLGSSQDAPFRNLAFNWNRIFKSSLVNELLIGYNQIGIVNHTLDWAGIGNGNQTFGIAGGQPIARPQLDRLGSGLTGLGAGASDSDTLDKHYQINEKLTWLKGRHSMKFGGQLIHYVQRALLRRQQRPARDLRLQFSVHGIRVLRLPARPGGAARAAAASRKRGRTCTTASALFVAGRLQAHAGPDLEPRAALGLHAAGRREGQPPVELRSREPARRSSPDDSSREGRRSTRRTTRASSRGSDSPGGRPIAGCSAAPTASRSTWKAPAPTCGCR